MLVDSNVLVSYLTDRDPQQTRLAEKLIEASAADDLWLLLHQQALTETVFVLQRLYSRTSEEISATLVELLGLPIAEPVHLVSWPLVFEWWPATVPDFSDACLAAAAKTLRCESVATFDRAFARKLRTLGLRTYW